MKTYSVKQISKMLSTNQETVRRWIRDGKLKAEQSSKKEGNVVQEKELKRFLTETPKYREKYMISELLSGAMATGAAGIAGATLAGASFALPGISTVIGSTLVGIVDALFEIGTPHNEPEIRTRVNSEIKNLTERVEQKEMLKKQTEQEIKELNEQIKQLIMVRKVLEQKISKGEARTRNE